MLKVLLEKKKNGREQVYFNHIFIVITGIIGLYHENKCFWLQNKPHEQEKKIDNHFT